jgi:exopolyphosphatase/guanosine-5'-triphosphate,3'-diphosphate pyrophosphatase
MPSGDNNINAVIDLGTNTCLLLIATLKDGHLKTLHEAQEIPRIGKGIYETHRISDENFAKAAGIFMKYKIISEELGAKEIHAFGTSALRDAVNSREFIDHIYLKTGIFIKVISGRQEAECAYQGAIFDLAKDNYAVIDIGGGSTELSFIEDGMLVNESANVGSVRITEKFFQYGYTDKAKSEAIEFINKCIDELPLFENQRKLVGVAGTLTTLSAIKLGLKEFDLDKIHGDTIASEEVDSIAEALFSMNEEERLQMGSYMKGRSDIITAGALILQVIMRKLNARKIKISAKGLRYGLMLSLDDFSYRH